MTRPVHLALNRRNEVCERPAWRAAASAVWNMNERVAIALCRLDLGDAVPARAGALRAEPQASRGIRPLIAIAARDWRGLLVIGLLVGSAVLA